MAAIYKGTKGPVLYAEDYDFDPERGRTLVQSMKGEKSLIYSTAWALEEDGYQLQIRKADGPYYTLEVFTRDIDNGPASSIRWSVSTAVIQTDIFSFPSIAAEMESYPPGPTAYRKGVEASLEDGIDIIAVPDGAIIEEATYPWAYKALQELRYGTTHFQEDRIILRRRETISGRVAAAPAMKVGISRLIYSTAQLQIPTNVPFTLPNLASLEARPESTWGWLFQGRDVEYDGVVTDRVHEFALYAWSTNLYTVAPAGNFDYTA